MKIKTYIIDAFTNEPFKGNPAGVCFLDNSLDITTMQSIASELNLAETAFLLQTNSDQFSIRYFTPTVEIPFCGHATLASSKFLLEYLGLSEVSFTTHYNLRLHAKKEADYIAMKFPLYDTVPYKANQELYDAFGIDNAIATRFCDDLRMLLIEVEDNRKLIAIQPDFVKALAATDKFRNVIVTAKSKDKEYDFYSRCFCPWIGIDEDPVTGASHTILAKYWGSILAKSEMRAYQSSKRGGYMNLKIIDEQTLEVTSNAKIILEGLMEV
jgi:PhzF family phenazine biosynthesis protein